MLTEKKIAALKLPKGSKLKRFLDSDRLHIEVVSNGHKHWRFRFKKPGGGEGMLSLGQWPGVSLQQAREKASKLRFDLMLGQDPSQQRREQEQKLADAEAATFESIARGYMSTRKELSARTQSKDEWVLNLLTKLHDVPVSRITAAQVHRLIEGIQSTGKNEAAHRCLQFINAVMDRAQILGHIQANPTARLGKVIKPLKVTNRPAITKPKEFGVLLLTVDNYPSVNVRHALQLLSHVFCRPGELRLARWDEFELSSKEPLWKIPGARMKMRRDHVIPLSKQVVALLKEQKKICGGDALVFPSGRAGKPLSDAALGAALHVLGYKDKHCPHGYRSSAATLLRDELHFESELVERALAHGKKNAVENI